MLEILVFILVIGILYYHRRSISFLYRKIIYKHYKILTTREHREQDHRILYEQFIIHNEMTREEYYSCVIINNTFECKHYPELLEYIGPNSSIVEPHLVSKLFKLKLSDDVLSAFSQFSDIEFAIILFTYDKTKRPMPLVVANTKNISGIIMDHLNDL